MGQPGGASGSGRPSQIAPQSDSFVNETLSLICASKVGKEFLFAIGATASTDPLLVALAACWPRVPDGVFACRADARSPPPSAHSMSATAPATAPPALAASASACVDAFRQTASTTPIATLVIAASRRSHSNAETSTPPSPTTATPGTTSARATPTATA
jgi:hypothetical protein